MAPEIEKRTVSSAHAQISIAIVSPSRELVPLLVLGDDQAW
jgi:hypothetical protein